MTRTMDWKPFKFFFWLAPVLITAGLTVGILSGWGAAAFVLLALGLVVAIAWAMVETRGGFWGRRSTQAGTNAVIATVAVVVILGLINFLGDRYAERIDLTENQLYTLAPQTQEVLQELDRPTKVWVFSATPNPADERLLRDYARTNDQFTYEYVDPQADPVLTRQFGVQTPGEVYIESGGDRRQLQSINPAQPLSERSLTNGIASLNTEIVEPSKIYFVQGHGERPLSAGQGGYSEVLAALEQENYIVEPLTLVAEGGVPEDADVVIIAGPQRELLEPEVEAIATYLQRSSGVMLLIDPTFNVGLDEVLADWGISLGNDTLIVDPSGQALGLGPGVPLVTQYGNHPITDGLDGISFYPLAQPIALEALEGVSSTPLLLTGSEAQVQRIDESGQVTTEEPISQGEPLAVGVAVERTVEATETETSEEADATESPDAAEGEAEESATPEDEATTEAEPGTTESPEATDSSEPSQARLVVIGNSSFASDGLFNQQLNSDVFLNAVNWLNQNEAAIAIRPKEATNRRILLTTAHQLQLAVVSLLIVPLIGFGIAFFLWLRRR
jgi:ABC-type uncharacterized transport system involved in gliding motility auxiliary subunit